MLSRDEQRQKLHEWKCIFEFCICLFAFISCVCQIERCWQGGETIWMKNAHKFSTKHKQPLFKWIQIYNPAPVCDMHRLCRNLHFLIVSICDLNFVLMSSERSVNIHPAIIKFLAVAPTNCFRYQSKLDTTWRCWDVKDGDKCLPKAIQNIIKT